MMRSLAYHRGHTLLGALLLLAATMCACGSDPSANVGDVDHSSGMDVADAQPTDTPQTSDVEDTVDTPAPGDVSDTSADLIEYRDTGNDSGDEADSDDVSDSSHHGYRRCNPTLNPDCSLDGTPVEPYSALECPPEPPRPWSFCSSQLFRGEECYYCLDMKGEEEYIAGNTRLFYCDTSEEVWQESFQLKCVE
jgi:hypothetical protein